MGNIRFFPFGYWDKNTMSIDEVASDENMNKVIDFCQHLNAKYSWDKGCAKHPDIEHVITVYFSNGYKDFQIAKNDTCSCYEMQQRLIEIRNFEIMANNPEHD